MNDLVKVGHRFYTKNRTFDDGVYYLSVGKYTKNFITYHILIYPAGIVFNYNLNSLTPSLWIIE